jgi:hypothetical protein
MTDRPLPVNVLLEVSQWVLRGVAECIIRYLFSLASSVLRALKALLEQILNFISIQIAILTAMLAQLDLLAKGEEILWNLVQAVIEKLKSYLNLLPAGPNPVLCPEFYINLTDPIKGLLDGSLEGLSVYRERYKGFLSFMDEVDFVLSHWTSVEQFLRTSIEICDEAILYVGEQEAIEASQNVIDFA